MVVMMVKALMGTQMTILTDFDDCRVSTGVGAI